LSSGPEIRIGRFNEKELKERPSTSFAFIKEPIIDLGVIERGIKQSVAPVSTREPRVPLMIVGNHTEV
jgi:hypothetical protein